MKNVFFAMVMYSCNLCFGQPQAGVGVYGWQSSYILNDAFSNWVSTYSISHQFDAPFSAPSIANGLVLGMEDFWERRSVGLLYAFNSASSYNGSWTDASGSTSGATLKWKYHTLEIPYYYYPVLRTFSFGVGGSLDLGRFRVLIKPSDGQTPLVLVNTYEVGFKAGVRILLFKGGAGVWLNPYYGLGFFPSETVGRPQQVGLRLSFFHELDDKTLPAE